DASLSLGREGSFGARIRDGDSQREEEQRDPEQERERRAGEESSAEGEEPAGDVFRDVGQRLTRLQRGLQARRGRQVSQDGDLPLPAREEERDIGLAGESTAGAETGLVHRMELEEVVARRELPGDLPL